MVQKRAASSYLELRYNTYYAVLYIPKDIAPILGKTKFYQSTRTSDKKLAQQRASALVFAWKQKISIARSEAPDPFIASALSLRDHIQQGAISLNDELIVNEVSFIEESQGIDAREDFVNLVTGKQEPLSSLLNGWKLHQMNKGLKAKTIDQWHRDLDLLTPYFRTAEKLTPKKISDWITFISTKAELSASSVTRILSACRNFYRYLKVIGQVPDDSPCPFFTPSKFRISKSSKKGTENKQTPWVPFEPDEVVMLHRSAIEQNKYQLADLIYIAAFTGARIEEICSLKLEDIQIKEMSMNIVDAKTEKGIRKIPIHKSLKSLFTQLIKTSTDGYLLSGLTFNKYQDRSNAIGKSFGRLKTKASFGRRHVFHSIRKTFTTKLENLGVPENVAADIVGHEKPNITYGLYSGGSSIENMRTVVNKVTYPKWAIKTTNS